MKTKLIFIFALLAFSGKAVAQSRDIGLQVGLNVPMAQNVRIGSDLMMGVSYGQFYYNGLGFRTGFQYAASTANINDVFGVPVAFAYRTHSKSAGERLESGAAGAWNQMMYRGTHRSDATGVLGGFLLNLFSDMEFFAGATPGYIAGASSLEVEKRHDFSLTLDAGMSLNYSIWRFDLKLTPAVHYNLTNNYLYQTTTPLRWFFTLNGGLSFRF